MKIVIIGSGIAGLSTYLFLRKHLLDPNPGQHSIYVYEAYDIHKLNTKSKPIIDPKDHDEPVFTPAAIGNAIGIVKNGLAVLGRLDNDGSVLSEMQRRGHPTNKWKISTARGWDIVDVDMASLGEGGQMYKSLMIGRQAAWEVLRDAALNLDQDAIRKKKVTGISLPTGADGKVVIEFADGSSQEADLLIGADGLRSVVRKTMFKDSKDAEQLGWIAWALGHKAKIKDYLTPHYEGLFGLGGFIPSSVISSKGQEPGAMGICFGPDGFFGCGYIDSTPTNALDISKDTRAQPGNVAAWWGTFSSSTTTPFPVKSGVADTTNSNFDREAALADLLKRYRSWNSPIIQAVLDHVEREGVDHTYPTYTTPELPTWQQNGKVVLVGDAAHALQPSSGQGANQALEDTETLALLLQHYLNGQTSEQDQAQGCAKALDKFVQLRKPRLHEIYVQSQRMSGMKADMNFLEERFMYFAIWMSTKMGFLKAYNDRVLNYDLPEEVKRALSE